MASQIKELSSTVISKLRSGINITSVGQCVEELVLNAVDSGATNIAIRVDLSIYRIQVVDNGEGISESNMKLIGTRYATSKCRNLEDLQHNLTKYGFRGEALASIIQVSGIVDITSRHKKSNKTYAKIFTYGKERSVLLCETNRPSCGTTVTIQDFMYNMPVRRKIIKEAIDIENIKSQVERIILISPNISVSLRNDKNTCNILQVHKCKSALDTFLQLFGKHHEADMAEVYHSLDQFEISGYISTQPHQTKQLQFIYINKRAIMQTKIHCLMNDLLNRSSIIRSRVLSNFAITGPGKIPSSPPKGLRVYGIFMLNITCPRNEYDICLEPKKTLVEFRDWEKLLTCVEELILKFVKEENLTISLDDRFRRTQKETQNFDSETPVPHSSQAVLQVFSNSKLKSCNEIKNNKITINNVKAAVQSLPARRERDIRVTPEKNVETDDNINSEKYCRESSKVLNEFKEITEELKTTNNRSSLGELKKVNQLNNDKINSCHKVSECNSKTSSKSSKLSSLQELRSVDISKDDANIEGVCTPLNKVIPSVSPQTKKRVNDNCDITLDIYRNSRKLTVVHESHNATPRSLSSTLGKRAKETLRKQQIIKSLNDFKFNKNSVNSKKKNIVNRTHIREPFSPSENFQSGDNSFHFDPVPVSETEKLLNIPQDFGLSSDSDSRTANNKLEDICIEDLIYDVTKNNDIEDCQEQVASSDCAKRFENQILDNFSLGVNINQHYTVPSSLTSSELTRESNKINSDVSENINNTNICNTQAGFHPPESVSNENIDALIMQPSSATSKGTFQVEYNGAQFIGNNSSIENDKFSQVCTGKNLKGFQNLTNISELDDHLSLKNLNTVPLCTQGFVPCINNSERIWKVSLPESEIFTIQQSALTDRGLESSNNNSLSDNDMLHNYKSKYLSTQPFNLKETGVDINKSEHVLQDTDETCVLQSVSKDKHSQLLCNGLIQPDFVDHCNTISKNSPSLIKNQLPSKHNASESIIFDDNSGFEGKCADNLLNENNTSPNDIFVSLQSSNNNNTENVGDQEENCNNSVQTDNIAKCSLAKHSLDQHEENTNGNEFNSRYLSIEQLSNTLDINFDEAFKGRSSKSTEAIDNFANTNSLSTPVVTRCIKNFSKNSQVCFSGKFLKIVPPQNPLENTDCFQSDFKNNVKETVDFQNNKSAKDLSNNHLKMCASISNQNSESFVEDVSQVSMEVGSNVSMVRELDMNLQPDSTITSLQYLPKESHELHFDKVQDTKAHCLAKLPYECSSILFGNLDFSTETSQEVYPSKNGEKKAQLMVNDESRLLSGELYPNSESSLNVQNFSELLKERDNHLTKSTKGIFCEKLNEHSTSSLLSASVETSDINLEKENVNDSGATKGSPSITERETNMKTGMLSTSLKSSLTTTSKVEIGDEEVAKKQADMFKDSSALCQTSSSAKLSSVCSWKVVKDKGKTVYVNIRSGNTSYEPPPPDPVPQWNSSQSLGSPTLKISITDEHDPLGLDRYHKEDQTFILTHGFKAFLPTKRQLKGCRLSEDLKEKENSSLPLEKTLSNVERNQQLASHDNDSGKTDSESVMTLIQQRNSKNYASVISSKSENINSSEIIPVNSSRVSESTEMLVETDSTLAKENKETRLKNVQKDLETFPAGSSTANHFLSSRTSEALEDFLKLNSLLDDDYSKWNEKDMKQILGNDKENTFDFHSFWENAENFAMDADVLLSNPEIQEPTNGYANIKSYNIVHPYKFKREMLMKCKVYGQVDNKFIAVALPFHDSSFHLIVLVDQHAADERVQLEKVLSQSYEVKHLPNGKRRKVLKNERVNPPIEVAFSADQVRLMKSYRDSFYDVGLEFTQVNDITVLFHCLPYCLVPKEPNEKYTKRCQTASFIVHATVVEICETIRVLGGTCDLEDNEDEAGIKPLPRPLSHIMNTIACKSAIKFGDELTLEECQSLISSLSECKLPFQCAHGRPSLVPIVDLKNLLPKKRVSKPNLKKLGCNQT